MDAWIETYTMELIRHGLASHPSWMRGLKQIIMSVANTFSEVASFVDAWIETFSMVQSNTSLMKVASFVDAWIETFPTMLILFSIKVASFVDAWIETVVMALMQMSFCGRILRGCVD